MRNLQSRRSRLLYLVQHAEAKGAAEDPERDLTEVGLGQAMEAGRFLAEQGVVPDLIWHSTKRRAEHTAQILAAAMGCPDKPRAHDHLLPGDDPTEIAHEVEGLSDPDLLIVGHLPFLERFAARLFGSASSPVRFHNGGIVALSYRDGLWAVEWLVIPGLFPKES